ncbi:uncharacterized protein [Acropora muricata]|uniref:uncharacterized protein n=1 Tax=Acropora muricata TaxID=159855 RepID=UPI0034E5EC9B
MLVHLFGARSSPSCSSFALKKTAEDNRKYFDAEIIDTVSRNFYVDDCLKSVASTAEAVHLVHQLPALLRRGGFRLTKWLSNHREVLASVPESDRAPSLKSLNLDLEMLPIERALGMQWDTEQDTFSFRTIRDVIVNTRKSILSVVSSLYDPLGLAAPMILPAEPLLQKMCKENLGWDDVICSDDLLHYFSDASEERYGVVSYLRIVDSQGNIACSILLGKARVPPLKTVTMPRLELTAATVAVKIHKQVREELTLPIREVASWTDSTIVLQYIKNSHTRFQTFIANRLATIHDLSSPSQWRYVSSDLNPADFALRGLRPHERAKLKIWLEGPTFLLQDENHWPVQPPYLLDISEDDRNVKLVKAQMYVVKQDFGADSLIHQYSSWFALKKAVAWVKRFQTYLRYQSGKITVGDVKRGELSVHELLNAEEKVVKHVQGLFFPKELAVLLNEATQNTTYKVSRSSGKRLCNVLYSSPLRKLNPVVVDGIIRVGGRLGNTDAVSYALKHPIILPNKHHVTDLIIRHYHQVGHVGATQVLAAIRRKFWILKSGTAERRVISKCIKGRKLNAKPEKQIMAPLPVARITPAGRCTLHIGQRRLFWSYTCQVKEKPSKKIWLYLYLFNHASNPY